MILKILNHYIICYDNRICALNFVIKSKNIYLYFIYNL